MDSTSHVINRAELVRRREAFWVNNEGIPVASTQGMTIRVHTPMDTTVQQMAGIIEGFTSNLVEFRKETCTSFEANIISTVHVRFSSAKGLYLEHGLQPEINDDNFKERYKNCCSISGAYVETVTLFHRIKAKVIITRMTTSYRGHAVKFYEGKTHA